MHSAQFALLTDILFSEHHQCFLLAKQTQASLEKPDDRWGKEEKDLSCSLIIGSVSCKCDQELGCQRLSLLTQTAQIYLKLHQCEEELEVVLGTSSSSVPRRYRQYFPEYRRIKQAKSMATFPGPSLRLGPIRLLWSCNTFGLVFQLSFLWKRISWHTRKILRNWNHQKTAGDNSRYASNLLLPQVRSIVWTYLSLSDTIPFIFSQKGTKQILIILKLPYLLFTQCHLSPYLSSSPFPMQYSAKVPWHGTFRFWVGLDISLLWTESHTKLTLPEMSIWVGITPVSLNDFWSCCNNSDYI